MTELQFTSDSFKRVISRLEELSAELREGLVALHERPDQISSNDLTVKMYLEKVWQSRYYFFLINIVFGGLAIIYSTSRPPIYEAKATYSISRNESSDEGLISRYSGIAAMAGIRVGSSPSSKIDEVSALIKSWPFLLSFVKQNALAPKLLAVERWNEIDQTIEYDYKMYDDKLNRWVSPDKNGDNEPSNDDIFKAVYNSVSFTAETETGLVKISVKHKVPDVAFDILNGLVDYLNDYFRSRDVEYTRNNIEYLEDKIESTGIAQMREVFYSMLDEQIRTLMLAENRRDYILQTVVSSYVPEVESGTPPVFFAFLVCFLFSFLYLTTFAIYLLMRERK